VHPRQETQAAQNVFVGNVSANTLYKSADGGSAAGS